MLLQQTSKLRKKINFPAKIITLDHSLTLIHQHMPATPVVVADVWVKAGARAEPTEWTGMAHFLEHIIFKGSHRVGVGEFDRAIEYNGGTSNAATSYDYAHFNLTTPAPYLKDTLPLLGDILLQPSIPPQEFEREKDIIIEEIGWSLDDPDGVGYESLCKIMHQKHPYGRSILGEEKQIRQYSPEMMRSFHLSHYQPENMTVAIVGGIEAETAVNLVKNAFSEFNSPAVGCPPPYYAPQQPLNEVRRQKIYLPRIEEARLFMGWIGPGIENFKDGIGLDILSVVLTGGMGSRLVRELREEENLVFDIDSDFSQQKDLSLFTITAWLEPNLVEIVEKKICDRILQLQNDPIKEVELARTQRLLRNDYFFSTETPCQLASLYGFYHTIARAELSLTYPESLDRFTAIELQKIARNYLSISNYGIVEIEPR